MIKEDKINGDLTIYQYDDGFRYGTDAVLLSAFTTFRSGASGAELGTGCGVVPILLNYHKKPGKIYAFEIQEDYAEIARKNAERCRYGGNIEVIRGSVSDCASFGISGLDFVFSNPPYMKSDSGKLNINAKKLVSRHEIYGGINDFCAAAAYLLKNGGYFFAVYRPDRLTDMIFALRANGLEPKVLQFVQSHAGKAPNLFLIKARKDPLRGGLIIKKPLVLYKTGAVMTEQLEYIYENGCFGGENDG